MRQNDFIDRSPGERCGPLPFALEVLQNEADSVLAARRKRESAESEVIALTKLLNHRPNTQEQRG